MTGTVWKRTTRAGKTVWAYVFDAGKDATTGKRLRPTKSGFRTRAEASTAMDEHQRRLQAGTEVLKDPRTVAEFFAEWFARHVSRNCSPKTAERYRQLAAYWTERLGQVALQKLTALQLERTLHEIQDGAGKRTRKEGDVLVTKPLSGKTMRHVAFVMNGMLEAAVRWGALPANPMARVSLPPVAPRELPQFSWDAIQRVLSAVHGHWIYPIALLTLATGARRGEILALTWADVDSANGGVWISKSIEQTRDGLRLKSTKSGRGRFVPLSAEDLTTIDTHRAHQAPTVARNRALFGKDYLERGLLFPAPDGDYLRPDSVTSTFCRLMGECGLKGISLHSLRHLHASGQLGTGTPLPTVSARLGHSSPAITAAIYSHTMAESDRAAAERWSAALRSRLPGQVQ
jgi:integrase